MFAIASFSAQWMLSRELSAADPKDPKHRWMLRTWIVIYVFVGIQMGWVLRPFIGDPIRRSSSSGRIAGATPTRSSFN